MRVQIITLPGSLNRDGQRQLTREATEIVVKIAGDEAQVQSTWLILSAATETGWGLAARTPFGKGESQH
ncbi:hypothetical protein BS297_27415 [Rhodococcus erythropolis]|uniref:4-oxalocrotonate tautomerase domain-containing protein n=1 Tax=Rhodococcus erythropolis TaxID=1833 RepID=A0A0C2WI62_RHOER|nr:hypothetical protein BS297_27415 [Rhodococcus erythropolis]KIM17502.1 hypothetical protein QV65_04475 [Rhodococcus erythropolis]